MKKIIVASKNPVKITATLQGFQTMFPGEEFSVEGVSVPSGVSDQPMTDAETLTGAQNRTINAQEAVTDADFYVGLEGGIAEQNGEMTSFAWIVVASNSLTGKGKTATLFLPPKIAELIKQGKELGEADDIVFGLQNSKQQSGAVGILTGDVITRTTYYVDAVILALIPFKNDNLYN